VVRGRLWRRSDPRLTAEARREQVTALMQARREARAALAAADAARLAAARAAVQASKVALGERGAVWWEDGAPDFNRRMAINTPYADWYAPLAETAERPGT